MAPSNDVALAGYSLLQLEAGLSTSSLATTPTTERVSSSYAVTRDMLDTVTQPVGSSALGLEGAAPPNFGLVVPGVYRSSYPQAHHFSFLQGLRLKTIVTLVQKELPGGFQVFMDSNGIRHVLFDMAGTKKSDIPLAMMRSIVGIVADKTNHPMLIHCNQGKHRTGCVVGVLRRYHGWDADTALDEYEKFAHPKVRPTDVQYLREFQLADLRHVSARRPERRELSLSIGQFILFYVIVVLGLLIWILSVYGFTSFPLFDPPRRPKTSEV